MHKSPHCTWLLYNFVTIKYLLYKPNIYIYTQKQQIKSTDKLFLFNILLSFCHFFFSQMRNILICTIFSTFLQKQKHPFMRYIRSYRLKPFSPPTTLFPIFLIPILIPAPSNSLISPLQDFNLLSIHLPHKGKTRNPEKVEYFQPPIRLPLSNLR